MNLKEQLKTIQTSMQAIVDGAKAAQRDLTDAEMSTLEAKAAEAVALKGKIEHAEKSAALMERIGGMKSDVEHLGGHALAGTGRKGFMSLTGSAGRAFTTALATKSIEQKGLVAAVPVALSPQSPVALGQVPASFLEALPVTEQASPVWRYPRQTVRTNNAAIVAPGGVKPTSIVTTTMIDGALKVFAHISEPVDEYVLGDNAALGRFLESEMRYMLYAAVEGQVLNGSGVGDNLRGILNTSGIQTQAFATDRVTTLRTAILKAENLGHSADLFILHPADWAAIETTRNASGAFDLGTAVDRAAQKVWGTQVVISNQTAPGTAVLLDTSVVELDTDLSGVQVKWGAQADGFVKNEAVVRVEGRFGVSVFQPAGIVKASLTA
jgi:HK97 family phage major capsid protein